MNQPYGQTSRTLLINEPEWRFVAGHPLHALGELSRMACGILAMTVVLIALIGIRLQGRDGHGQHDADK
jgi:hypothetical protein